MRRREFLQSGLALVPAIFAARGAATSVEVVRAFSDQVHDTQKGRAYLI